MKMKLQLENLHVESFEVAPELDGHGTVKGHIYEDEFGSGIHSQCWTHCLSGCENSCTCPSNAPTHCKTDSCGGDVPA